MYLLLSEREGEMSYRFMRILVMFDLPVSSTEERREYTKFRKYLIKNGFMMLQESVYCKLAQNNQAADAIIENIYKNHPPKGLVQAIKVTEKQYSKMEVIVGNVQTDVIDNDERILFL